MDQPTEENPGFSLSQCLVACKLKPSDCKMVIYDSKIQDCGMISKFYEKNDLASTTEQVRTLRSDIIAYKLE